MDLHASLGFLVSACLAVGAGGCGGTEGVDPDAPSDVQRGFQRDMLAAHNAVRAQVVTGAAEPLPPLQWSAEAEQVAAAWAEECVFEHNPERGRMGENLAAATPNQWRTQEEVVRDWASEVEDYDAASNTCAPGKVCGHYTQLVWRETTHVGCAMKLCTGNSPWGAEVSEWKLWVCNYTPPGNVVGQRPY